MKPAALVLALLLGGCVYLNTLYNARQLYEEGERARLAGQAETARVAYRQALDKASSSFRRDSTSGWGLSALILVGRSHLRLGEPDRARAALEEVLRSAEDPGVTREARLYLAAALAASGEHPQALDLLNESLRELDDGSLRGEGHMWRARVLLAMGLVDQGWWDLERAVESDPRLRVPGQLERMGWAILQDDLARGVLAAGALFDEASASIWSDSVASLVGRAAIRWGPGDAAVLLAPARATSWAPPPRDTLLLYRARLLLEAGDTLAAETELGWVAQGAGPGSVPARMALSDIRLRRMDGPGEIEGIRDLLLPASTDVVVLERLEVLRMLEILVSRREDRFAALFAAGELAREVLEAPALAAYLFSEAARDSSGGVWRGKAALAALGMAVRHGGDAGTRELLVGLGDPYVTRARNRYLPTDTVMSLDARLQPRLDQAREWAREEARRRDVLIRSRAGGK